MRAELGQSRGGGARQKEGRSEEEHLTLCLAACRTQLIPMLRQRILGRATCVNKRIESVLVTLSSVLSSRFPSTVPFCFTSLQLIPPPYRFLSFSLRRPRRFPFSVSLRVFLLLLEVLRSRRFARLLFPNFVPSAFLFLVYVNRPLSVSNSVISSQTVTCNISYNARSRPA